MTEAQTMLELADYIEHEQACGVDIKLGDAQAEKIVALIRATAAAQPVAPVAAALARRLCQMFDSGGESQRSARSRHASAIFQILNIDAPEYLAEQIKCDTDPVGYLAERLASPSPTPAGDTGAETTDQIVQRVKEACVGVCDRLQERDAAAYSAALKDEALSHTGRETVLERLDATRCRSRDIGISIRALIPVATIPADTQAMREATIKECAEIARIIGETAKEAHRVAADDALMAFKWNDHSLRLQTVLRLLQPYWEPLFGHGVTHQQRGTSWVMLRRVDYFNPPPALSLTSQERQA